MTSISSITCIYVLHANVVRRSTAVSSLGPCMRESLFLIRTALMYAYSVVVHNVQIDHAF